MDSTPKDVEALFAAFHMPKFRYRIFQSALPLRQISASLGIGDCVESEGLPSRVQEEAIRRRVRVRLRRDVPRPEVARPGAHRHDPV